MFPAPFYPSTARPACRSADSGRGHKRDKSLSSLIKILVLILKYLSIHMNTNGFIPNYEYVWSQQQARGKLGWLTCGGWLCNNQKVGSRHGLTKIRFWTFWCPVQNVQVFRHWQFDQTWKPFHVYICGGHAEQDGCSRLPLLVIHLTLKWLMAEWIMWSLVLMRL